MGEPAGLGLSLDDLIKKNSQQQRRGSGRGRGVGSGGRGAGNQLGVQGGAVAKVRSPPQKDRGGYGMNGYGGGRGGGRGGYQQGGGRSGGGGGQYGGGHAGGRAPYQQHRGSQQHRAPYQQNRPQRARPPTFPLAGAPAEDQPMSYRPVEVDVWLDEDTGNVVATLQDTNIVTVGPDGTILLDTGGWTTISTLNAMNEALSYLHMKVNVQGDLKNIKDWEVSDGMSIKRFTTSSLVLPPKGPVPHLRGQLLWDAYYNPMAYTMAMSSLAAGSAPAAQPKLRPAAGSTAAAGGSGVGVGGGAPAGMPVAAAAAFGGPAPLNQYQFGQMQASMAAANNSWGGNTDVSMGSSGAAQRFGAGAGAGLGGGMRAPAFGPGAGVSPQDADIRRLKAQGRMGP